MCYKWHKQRLQAAEANSSLLTVPCMLSNAASCSLSQAAGMHQHVVDLQSADLSHSHCERLT